MIDLSTQQIDQIKSIIGEYSNIPLSTVYVFGSRAKSDAREYSDLDLLIDHTETMPLTEIFKLRDGFEESTLPFRVDIIDKKRISTEFFNAIAEDCTRLFE